MTALIRFFIDRPLLVHVIVIATLAGGVFILRSTQREGFPATSLNLVRVGTILPGAAAADVESQITVPLERAIRRVDAVDRVTSTSADQVSSIIVELEDGLDDDGIAKAADEIRARLQSVDLPEAIDAPPDVAVLDPARIPALEVFLHGGDWRTVVRAARDLQDRLERVDGVSEAVLVGAGDEEIRVYLDPARAAALSVTLDEVMLAISKRNRSDTGGVVDTVPAKQQVVLRSSYRDATDVASTIVRVDPSGAALTVADVARVEAGPADLGVRVIGDGERGVSLVVRKRPSADIIRVVDRLRDLLDEHQTPDGVELSVYRDSSKLARDRLSIVGWNGLGGIVLVLLVLVLFLSVRIAFWVAFGIPFAVLGTLLLLPTLDISVNMVSMAAFVLVIGLIVDDAIVVAERIAFYRERGLSPREAGVRGTSDMAMPVIASSATTVMAFTPMLAVGGLPGRFAWAIPTVVVVALTMSLIECFFLLPSHVAGHEGRRGAVVLEKAAWMVALEETYRGVLRRALAHRKKLVFFFTAFFGISIAYAFFVIPFTLFPQDDAKVLMIKLELPLSTPVERTEAILKSVDVQVRAILGDDLLETNGRVGHRLPQSTKTVGDGTHEAILVAFLVDDFRLNAPAWGERLRPALAVPPEARLTFEHQTVGPPLGSPVTVHIESDDEDRRRRAVLEVSRFLDGLPGVTDVEADDRTGLPQIDLQPAWDQLAKKGVDVDQLIRTVKAGLHGLPVTEVHRGDEVVRIRVQFDPSSRSSLEALLDTPVRSAGGFVLPLRDLVQPRPTTGLARIHHRDGRRTTTVTGRIAPGSGLTSSSVAKTLTAELLSRESLRAPGLTVSVGGEAEASAKTVGELPLVALMAFIGMLMIVTLLFGSVLQAVFIVVAVPLGYAGVVWTFAAHGVDLSFFALLGAIGLSGVVVNDSIVMVSTLTRKLTETADRFEAVVEGAAERLRPVLLTTLTTVVGVMPTAYGLGGRDALLSPMSLALGWGLVFATLVTLLLVPALFLIRGDISGDGQGAAPADGEIAAGRRSD